MAQTVFNRYEKKYLMPEHIYYALRERLASYMQQDTYGLHTICNIYYDTPEHELIRRSIEHPVYKEKLRLRSYGIPGPESAVFLEIKKKYQQVVNKRRVQLTLREAYAYLEQGVRPQTDSQILREIDFLLRRCRLERGLYLAYDRLALFARQDPDFRLTFDWNIRSRQQDMGLECGDRGEALLPKGCCLMESKVMGAAPLWFARILSELALYPVSFSKYGNIYKKGLSAFCPEQVMTHCMENWNEVRRETAC